MDEAFLLEHGVGEWMELPLWLAESNGDFAHMLSADVSRAVEAGLRFRPVSETVRATLEWARAQPDRQGPLTSGVEIGRAGMDPEREAELLAAWHGR